MQPNHPYGPYGQEPRVQQQGPYPNANPYAQPAPQAMYRQNEFVPSDAVAGPLVGSALRKVKLGFGVTQLVTLFAFLALVITGVSMPNDSGEPWVFFGFCVFGLWYLLLIGYAIINVIWLYKFWSWIPPHQRHTNLWKKYISPGTAIGFMFIPYFSIYWMVVIYLGLADIMERMRVQYPSSKGSVKTLALVSILSPFVFFPAAPIVHYLFAKHLEEMATEMHAQMGRQLPV